mgnify:FL=1
MKKKTANFLMVLAIAVIVLGGVLLAFALREQTSDHLGSSYQIAPIPDNCLAGGGDKTCTITIVCPTIFDNLNSLNAEKAPFIPKDGTILPSTKVTFTEGETVFDVLKRVCDAAQLQIEYSYTPLYESYYVEGINHLYEFDCGPESGWMFKVNEWFPNYGCSAYTLKDGDDIVWCYTCTGLGADVGETWMSGQ